MNEEACPRLRFLHSADLLNPVKLDALRQLSTEDLKLSLLPGAPGSLKARPDGTLLDGHHRIFLLIDRGVDTNLLPRQIIDKEHDS